MDIILWGIGNSLVIMGLLFASLNGINMGKDNILEGVQNASARLPLLKNDRGKVKVIKEEKRKAYRLAKGIVAEKTNLNIGFGMSTVGTFLLAIFDTKRPEKLSMRVIEIVVCCAVCIAVWAALKDTITRGKNKEIREEIKKNEDATIPVGALVFQEDDEY